MLFIQCLYNCLWHVGSLKLSGKLFNNHGTVQDNVAINENAEVVGHEMNAEQTSENKKNGKPAVKKQDSILSKKDSFDLKVRLVNIVKL